MHSSHSPHAGVWHAHTDRLGPIRCDILARDTGMSSHAGIAREVERAGGTHDVIAQVVAKSDPASWDPSPGIQPPTIFS